jgi:hypothetical protein
MQQLVRACYLHQNASPNKVLTAPFEFEEFTIISGLEITHNYGGYLFCVL